MFETSIIAKLLTAPGEVYYWREGQNEVDAVWEYGDNLLALEIKSSTRKNNKGLELFRHRFPKAKTMLIDESLGTKILEMPSVKDFLIEVSGR